MKGFVGQPLNTMRAVTNISFWYEERRFPIAGQYARFCFAKVRQLRFRSALQMCKRKSAPHTTARH